MTRIANGLYRDADDFDQRESHEPRSVGQFMNAVLARYGIDTDEEPERPRLPIANQRIAAIGVFATVG